MSDQAKEAVKLSANAQKIMDLVKDLSVMELADLVKGMEEEFGVSAQAPAAVAVAGAPAGDAGASEEKKEFTIELIDAGAKKIDVIKAVKEITGQGLAEAKAMVEGAPAVVKEKVAKAEAEEIKGKLEAAGAKVELK